MNTQDNQPDFVRDDKGIRCRAFEYDYETGKLNITQSQDNQCDHKWGTGNPEKDKEILKKAGSPLITPPQELSEEEMKQLGLLLGGLLKTEAPENYKSIVQYVALIKAQARQAGFRDGYVQSRDITSAYEQGWADRDTNSPYGTWLASLSKDQEKP